MITRLSVVELSATGSEAVRQAAEQRSRMTNVDQLVPGSTTLLLRALGGKEMTETGRAAHELALGGQLEALGDRLLGLLHGNEGSKTEGESQTVKGKVHASKKRSATMRTDADWLDEKGPDCSEPQVY